MKTKYLFFGFTVLLVTGCVNEEFKTTPSVNSVRVFADMPSTRVSFTEGDAVTYATWQDGDVISLSTDLQSNLQYVAGVVEEGNAGMEFLPGGEALLNNYGKVVYACYPSAVTDMENMTVPLPNTENYNQPDFRPFVYAIDTLLSERLYLRFHHPYAYLKLTFTEGILPPDTTTIGSVMVTSEEVIAAKSGVLNFSTQAVEVNEGSKSMLIERLDGQGHDLTQSPYTLYIPILPQSEGTKITIQACYTFGEGIDNQSPYYKVGKTVPVGGFQAGHIYTLTLGNDRKPGIYTAQDLVEIRANPHDLSKWMDADSVINIMADIDMIGVSDWDGGWNIERGVVLEGNNHKIFNIAIPGGYYGFFGRYNMGTIRNLTLSGEIMYTEGEGRGGAFCTENYGVILNCQNYVNINTSGRNTRYGGFCFETYGVIQDCANYGNIKATSACGIAMMDGVSVSGERTILNCRNYGTIECNGNKKESAQVNIGGISSKCVSGIIKECVNEGKIIADVSYYAGGICGMANGNSQITYCQNAGDVSNGSGGVTGGIVGYAMGGVQVSNCKNTGAVSSTSLAGGICGTIGADNIITDNINGGTVNGVAGSDANAIGG